jgi:hypothetical protein
MFEVDGWFLACLLFVTFCVLDLVNSFKNKSNTAVTKLFIYLIIVYACIRTTAEGGRFFLICYTVFALLMLFVPVLKSKYIGTVEGFHPHSAAEWTEKKNRIGPYDGLRLDTGCRSDTEKNMNWKRMPCDAPILNPAEIETIQGTQAGLHSPKNAPIADSVDAPPVQGGRSGKEEPTSLFMLAYNQCKPECCPSIYSCDRGCVCLTPEQSNWISTHGGNSTAKATVP